MLSKISFDSLDLEPSSAEEWADTLFEIGRSQSRRSRWSEAVYWLEKAHDAITGQDLQELSSDAENLQIGILHGLARAFINQKGEDNRAKAWDIIHKLSVECGNRLIVLLLKLDVFALDPTHASQNYRDVLQTIVNTVHLSDTNIKTVLHHAHKLRTISPVMVHDILIPLLTQRLLGTEKPDWLERVFVIIIWNSTTFTDFQDIFSSLTELLDTLASISSKALSPSATHTAHIVSSV